VRRIAGKKVKRDKMGWHVQREGGEYVSKSGRLSLSDALREEGVGEG